MPNWHCCYAVDRQKVRNQSVLDMLNDSVLRNVQLPCTTLRLLLMTHVPTLIFILMEPG